MGQGSAGRKTGGLNVQQLGHGMQLKNLACVCICMRASAFACVHLFGCVRASAFACVCLRVSVHRKFNVWTHLDAKGSLHPDASFVRRLFECTIPCFH